MFFEKFVICDDFLSLSMGKEPVQEIHRILRTKDRSQSFASQMDDILGQITTISEGKMLRFVRFFISDADGQMDAVSSAASTLDCPVSVIEQPPLDGSKIAAWGYWTVGQMNPAYSHRMVCGLRPRGESSGAVLQTEEVFADYESILSAFEQCVADDCVRTWLFVRDVDVNYGGVVNGRKNYFDRIGLTRDTHYLASTGIQGCCEDCRDLVVMDAYSAGGLLPGQKRHLYAASHLCPTHDYGVTFERGTLIDYGDRRHVFISGTASIDNKGQVLFEGDVVRQCERMMENVSVLLSEADCSLSEVSVSILYLRNAADYPVVSALFKERWPSLDPVIVLAPVCRPTWLVELECIAARPISAPQFPEF